MNHIDQFKKSVPQSSDNETYLKLYIAVLDVFPDHMVPTLVAHSMLSAHLKFENETPYKEWLNHSFRKVVVRVNAKEFKKICDLDINNVHIGFEKHTLNGDPACAIPLPVRTDSIPSVLKYAKLWKPTQ